MKKYVLPLALVTATSLTACKQEKAPEESQVAAAPAEQQVALESTASRLSYGLGFGMGQRMADDPVEMNVDAFAEGLRDGLDGKEGRMTMEEIQAEMDAYREKAEAEAMAAREAEAAANLEAGKQFLAENAAREGVTVTESGLQYEVLVAGEGAKPTADDTVDVHYTGTLVDGTEFDSSHKYNQSIQFGVGQVIPGWTEALQLMQVGSKWRIVIPSDLAYGPGGAGGVIGPNATLVFEVELLDIVKPETEGADSAQ
ncbi:MAG: FKBP-type peptidyl-prolyl cis-trans isomerase [Parahaliea sp.]